MVELLVVSIISLFFLILLPRIRQLDDEYTEKYNKNNKWKENISQHYNGYHNQVNSFGYQDYKYDDE
jgi:competence protein ComGC